MRPILIVAVLCAASTSRAAPIDEAKAAFTAGKAAFERGDYETALANYQRANLIVPAPSLSYNIGTTYEHLGKFHDAALAFERYLEQSGPPASDEDKEFQENLRARAAADRKRADAPTQQQNVPQPPPPAYTAPANSPYYYSGAPVELPREQRLAAARDRRTRAIVLLAIGLAFDAIGIGFIAAGFTNPHSCVNNFCTYNYVEDWAGATFFIVGVTLWAPGAASYVGAEKQIKDLSKPEPATAPKAALLWSPVFRF